MTTTTGIELQPSSQTALGEGVVLARYEVPAGERVVYCQRVDGVIRVTDVPASGRGRAYLVEQGLEDDGYDALKALVADYVEQSQILEAVPMAVSLLNAVGSEEDAR